MLATSLSDESQLAQETIVQWGLVLRLAADLSAFSKEPDFENQVCKIIKKIHFIHNGRFLYLPEHKSQLQN